MTDRHAGYVVTLKDSIRDDDAEPIMAAIRQLRGVVAVEPIVEDVQQMLAEARQDMRWRDALVELIRGGVADGG